jgi:hypothetical protein
MAIPRGTIISEGCVPGTTTYRIVKADGNGGTYNVDSRNSTQCGYVPPPAAGTLLRTACVGFDKMGYYAAGDGTEYTAVIEHNSTECGYVAPEPLTRVSRADKITADYFNALKDNVNELYGDTHAGEGPSHESVVQDAIRWGWGGEHVPEVARGEKVTADYTNEIVNRINLSTLRTNSTDQELVIVSRGDKITADFFNTATRLLEGARNFRNEVDPALTTISIPY